MSIRYSPPPFKDDWDWVWIFFSRQIGNYKVAREWVQRRVTHHGNSYTVEWCTHDGKPIHQETETNVF